MSPDVLTDVGALFVLGYPSRTTAEDVLLTDAYFIIVFYLIDYFNLF
jgi:hypothetical protein